MFLVVQAIDSIEYGRLIVRSPRESPPARFLGSHPAADRNANWLAHTRRYASTCAISVCAVFVPRGKIEAGEGDQLLVFSLSKPP